jgi:hypothetical protein
MRFILCTRCFKTPDTIAKGQTMFNYETVEGKPLCSMECKNDPIDAVSETARLGVLFVNDSLKFHFLLSCGREDDSTFHLIQARRMAVSERILELAKTDAVKAVSF